MNSLLAAGRTLLAGLDLQDSAAAELLRPAVEFDELAARRLHRQIQDARQQLRDAVERHTQARVAHMAAEQPLKRAETGLAAVEPAVKRASAAREAELQGRREALERGGDADRALVDAAAAAVNDLREARRTQRAAEDVIPTLHRRVANAEAAVRHAHEDIGAAIGAVMVATLAERVSEAHALAARLSDCYLELASLSELLLRGPVSGISGTVPIDLVPQPPQFQFTAEELQPSMQLWREFARQLRENPDTSFDCSR